jgi:hypothetical protein
MKDVFNCLFSGLLVAVDVPVYPNNEYGLIIFYCLKFHKL